MKKLFCLLLAMCLVIPAFAEDSRQEEDLFDRLSSQVYYFSSGAGAWYTELLIAPDGSFTGSFHDAEAGEAANAYPDGTVYFCSFCGRFVICDAADGAVRSIAVKDLTVDDSEPAETIEETMRFVRTDPYGLAPGAVFAVYEPGFAAADLPEGAAFWFHLSDFGEPYEVLPFFGLYDAGSDVGFAGES